MFAPPLPILQYYLLPLQLCSLTAIINMGIAGQPSRSMKTEAAIMTTVFHGAGGRNWRIASFDDGGSTTGVALDTANVA